jgi:putative chitinase
MNERNGALATSADGQVRSFAGDDVRVVMNRQIFFSRVRHSVFGGRLGRAQVEGLTKILDYRDDSHADLPAQHVAYVLATATWETGRRMRPVREGGGEAYLRRKPYYPWVGEGLIQVTWERNARKFGATKPGDCMSWPVALRALFEGMIDGAFTGKRLEDFINEGECDFVGARRIVNGRDRAREIADIAIAYYQALVAAADDSDATDAADDDGALIDGKELRRSKTVGAGSMLAGATVASAYQQAMDALDKAKALQAKAQTAADAFNLNLTGAVWAAIGVAAVVAFAVIVYERRQKAQEFGI